VLFLTERRQAQDTGPHAVNNLVVQADLDVIQNCHIIKQADVLERAGNARLADGFRGGTGNIVAIQHNVALGGLIHTGQHIEHGGFARAVGADQAIQMAFFDFKVQLRNGLQAAERNAKVTDFQQCHLCRLLFAFIL